MNNPVFSIIVPVYNVEDYLEHCLNSIVDQSFTDYEVILVDDGSTDACPEICDSFVDRHNCFQVIHKINGGLSSARNVGIRVAKGDYLLFIDSDDFLIGNDALEMISNSLKRNDVDLLICLADEYDEKAESVIYHHSTGPWKEGIYYNAYDIINSLYALNGIWVTAAPIKIISRYYCNENRLFFFEGIYHEDDEWIARVLLSGPLISFLYHPWYGYRHRDNSIVSTLDSQKIFKKICDKIKVADSMLKNKSAKKYKDYLKYASDYFLNTLISSNLLPEDKQKDFLAYLKNYRKSYKMILYSKNIKLILKSLYILLFGEKRFINKYKG